jgi:hypothetical protein
MLFTIQWDNVEKIELKGQDLTWNTWQQHEADFKYVF